MPTPRTLPSGVWSVPRRFEAPDWCTVVALDPGGTTGWSVLSVYPDALSDPDVSVLKSITHHAHGQVGGNENDQAVALGELIAAWPGCALVLESFTLRKFTKGAELLAPVRVISKMELIVHMRLCGVDHSPHMWYQEPSLAKRTATDDRLKDWGLYQREGGEGHARDADRHAITFLRRASQSKQLRHHSWPGTFDKHGRLLER